MPFDNHNNAQDEIDAMMARYTGMTAHEHYKKWVFSTGMDEAFEILQYEHKGDFGNQEDFTDAEAKELMDRTHRLYQVRARRKCMDNIKYPALQVIGSFNGSGQKFFNLGNWRFPDTEEEMKQELKEFFGEYEDLYKVSCEYRTDTEAFPDLDQPDSPDWYSECNGKFFYEENITW